MFLIGQLPKIFSKNHKKIKPIELNEIFLYNMDMYSKHPLYPIFNAMHSRCENEKNLHYKDYGGRGIHVSREWARGEAGFKLFVSHLGDRPSKNHSIDRIDVNGNYEPGNVRWATPYEQAANKRPITAQKWTAEGYIVKSLLPLLLYM